MKRLLLGNAFLAAAISLVFNGLFFSSEPPMFSLEGTLRADVDASVQVYYDIGEGLREEHSSREAVLAGASTPFRFGLPQGEYRILRLDPLDRPGRVTVSELILRSPSGRELRRFQLGDFLPNEQLTVQPQRDGAVAVHALQADPILELTLAPPLVLQAGQFTFFLGEARRFGGLFAGAFALLVVGQLLARRHRPRLAAAWAARHQRPLLTLAIVSGVAALLACHPLVIGGKSLLSPNFGIALLYEGRPTVPGFVASQVENVPGTDLGAMMWQHLPYTVIESQALRAGEFPLWNRYGSTGVTLLGQGQSMLGDPLHLPVVLTNGASWAFDAKFVLLRALFACGLAWTVFALRRDWSAAAIVGLAAPFIGLFTFRINHPAIFSQCYAPWVLFAWVRFVQADTIRGAARACALWFAANWILLASGTVKEADMLLAALNAIGIAAFIFSRDPGGRKLVKTGLVALTVAAFVLAAMPLWLTFADTLVRSQNFSEHVVANRIPRRWLLGLFDDLFYRELNTGRAVLFPAMNLLLGVGVVWSIARFRDQLGHPIIRWIFLGGAVAVGIAVNWFPSEWILRVPGLANLQRHHDVFSSVAIVILSVLAGCGFASARAWFTQPAGRRVETVALLGLIPAVLLYLYFGDMPFLWRTQPTWPGYMEKWAERRVFYGSVLAMAAAILLLHAVARRALRSGLVSWAGISWSALALTVLLARHGLQLPLGFRDAYFITPPPRGNLQAASPAVELLRQATAENPGRVIGTGATLVPNFGAQFGLEAICGPDALMNRHYRQLILSGGVGVAHDWYIEGSLERMIRERAMLDLLNVRFCVSPRRDLSPETGDRQIADLDLVVYERPTAWPRAFFTDRIVPYRGAHEVAERARAQPGEPFAAILESDLAQLPPGTLQPPGKPTIAAPASAYRLTPNATSFSVRAPGPGVIVLHEAWLKGDFRATVNGAPAEYFRVNHAFKGIAVPAAGDYRVTFTYWPRHLTRSLLYSAAGFALLGLILHWARRRPANR